MPGALSEIPGKLAGMEEERWELLSDEVRADRARDAVLTFIAIADIGRQKQDLGERTDTYPTTHGEWLVRAVQLGAGAVWQAPSIPLLLMPGDSRYPDVRGRDAMVRTQAAQRTLIFGGGLWSALLGWRCAWDDDDAQYAAIEEIVDYAVTVLEEVREESDGFAHSLNYATDAVWTYTVYLERGATPPADAITKKLTDALGWLAAAVACTDTVVFSGFTAPAE